ncbi:hypothetical protein CcarbDRAFT_5001 [Clostridium carboxidivorans P7]|uniref:Lantibiotic n=1 Tax=Clostridium carboxidivorans P7 TaxID=536227 RepID=C6Q1T3_9CLOT|nr:hypothetical protein [Clostridium carboxidivorans]EET84550.1 hypothetical protein CcarbDRAFT_5001 [Clostridium carboxidivorans P7]EFG89850.1 hypothetical protein CLCAR_0043 [Clostridium carboxidivorans P7]
MEKIKFSKNSIMITAQESVGITIGTCSVPGDYCGSGSYCNLGFSCVDFNTELDYSV